MVLISSFFLYWAPIPAPAWVIVALCLGTWSLAVIVHFFLDDYFLLKEQVRNKTQNAESNILKRADSRFTTKTQKTMRFIDLGRGCCGCIQDTWEAIPFPWRARRVPRGGSEDDLPSSRQLAPIKELPPVLINDPMLPSVGLLERQASVIMTDKGIRELSADNPNYYSGDSNRDPENSIRVPVMVHHKE